MLLAFDIGNSNVVVGCFDDSRLICRFRFRTDPRRTVDEYYVLLQPLLQGRFSGGFSCGRAIISSVVPPVTTTIVDLTREHFGVEPLVVGPGVKTGLSIQTAEPAAVGSDRVVNAVAAKQLFGLPALVIDFGTATSFDYVDEHSSYRGGLIVPGIEISLDALVERTAKLPRIELVWPESVVGRNTVEAMQSGTVLGYHCLVEGVIDRVIGEVGEIPHIVATGGLGRIMFQHSKKIRAFEPDLTLQGMRVLAELNSGGGHE